MITRQTNSNTHLRRELSGHLTSVRVQERTAPAGSASCTAGSARHHRGAHVARRLGEVHAFVLVYRRRWLREYVAVECAVLELQDGELLGGDVGQWRQHILYEGHCEMCW
jgi:hypothetical protein